MILERKGNKEREKSNPLLIVIINQYLEKKKKQKYKQCFNRGEKNLYLMQNNTFKSVLDLF